MIKNRFFKTTLGFMAEVVLAKKIDTSNAAAQQTTYQGFITNAVAGDLSAFWEDTGAVVAAGATALAANAARKFFYAFKLADGTVKTTTPILAGTRVYDSKAYNAGTAQVSTVTFGGTYSLGQTVFVTIIETTGTLLPFPKFSYEVKIGAGGINQAVTDLVALINAEPANNSPIVTASGATNVLTLTCNDKIRNFKTITDIATTAAQPTDQTAPVVARTVAQVYPSGDVASIKELLLYYKHYQGGQTYVGPIYTAEEFNAQVDNLDASGATQYGVLLVKNDRTETGGVMEPKVNQRTYTLVIVPTGNLATVAGW